jgi:hypothetical protein
VWCTGSWGPMMVSMALVPHSVGLPFMLFLAAVISAERLLIRAVNHLRVVAALLATAAVAVTLGVPGT